MCMVAPYPFVLLSTLESVYIGIEDNVDCDKNGIDSAGLCSDHIDINALRVREYDTHVVHAADVADDYCIQFVDKTIDH